MGSIGVLCRFLAFKVDFLNFSDFYALFQKTIQQSTRSPKELKPQFTECFDYIVTVILV